MSLSIHTAEELSKLPFIEELTTLKKEVDSLKPLPKETEDRVLQKIRLDWTYNSNAIEGNKLTYGETVAFLMEGLTAKGKPFKDHLDIKGHSEAINYLLHLVKEPGYELTEVDIRNLHQMLLKEPYWSDAVTKDGIATKKEIKIGQYKSSPNHVITPTGETHFYATPEETPIKMGELMDWYKNALQDNQIHPLVLSTLFHHEFTSIHPFDDGNGRMARLLMNLMLMQAGYPPIVVKQEDRQNYYQVLRQADVGQYIPITEYMSNLLTNSLRLYLSAARGESIEEESDIDKEIELFKRSLEEENKIEKEVSPIEIEKSIKEIIFPFFDSFFSKLKKLDDLFIKSSLELKNSSNDFPSPLKWKDNTANSDNLFFNPHKLIANKDIDGVKLEKATDYNISQFSILINLEGYKKSNKAFSISLRYDVHFSNFFFFILNHGNHSELIQLPYGQKISKEKIKKAIDDEVRRIIEQLKQFS